MKDLNVSVKSHDGKKIIIRTAQPSDASQLIALKLSYIAGSVSIPLFEDEYKNNKSQEAEMIQRYLEQDNSILLIAEHGGKLIGNLDLTGNQRRKLYHTGMIGMGIHNDWQNKGIGNLLLQHTIMWAKQDSPLSIIWLEVYSDNAAGRKLYTKNGFMECGMIENFFGNADKITMAAHL